LSSHDLAIYHDVDITITPKKNGDRQATNAFEKSRLIESLQLPHPNLDVINENHIEFENLMTLKQAYPSEYQRVQGAFKDSMIH
jgi:hypothetical protein